MLAHRLRRWPNIEPSLVQCLIDVFMDGRRINVSVVGLQYIIVYHGVYISVILR